MRQFISPKGMMHGVVLADELGDQIGSPVNPLTLEDHSDAIADGLVAGAKAYNIDGFLLNVTTTLTDLNEAGNTVIPVPSTAQQMNVKSTSINDTLLGSNARTVEIVGLDSNYAEISEIVELNGTTNVVTANSYLRINNMHVQSNAGHGVTAAGNITIKNLANTITYDIIKAGSNADLQSHFTVPNGKKAFIETIVPSIVTEKKDTYGRIILRSTTDWNDRTINLPGIYLFERLLVGADTATSILVKPHLVFPPKCDIKVSAQQLTGTGTMSAACQFMIVIQDL